MTYNVLMGTLNPNHSLTHYLSPNDTIKICGFSCDVTLWSNLGMLQCRLT